MMLSLSVVLCSGLNQQNHFPVLLSPSLKMSRCFLPSPSTLSCSKSLRQLTLTGLKLSLPMPNIPTFRLCAQFAKGSVRAFGPGWTCMWGYISLHGKYLHPLHQPLKNETSFEVKFLKKNLLGGILPTSELTSSRACTPCPFMLFLRRVESSILSLIIAWASFHLTQ